MFSIGMFMFLLLTLPFFCNDKFVNKNLYLQKFTVVYSFSSNYSSRTILSDFVYKIYMDNHTIG